MHQLATFFKSAVLCFVLLILKVCVSVRGQSTVSDGRNQNELVCSWDNEYVQSLAEQTRDEEQRRHGLIVEEIKAMKNVLSKIQDATVPATNDTAEERRHDFIVEEIKEMKNVLSKIQDATDSVTNDTEEHRRHASIIEAIKTLKDELMGQDSVHATNQTKAHILPFASPSTLADNCMPLLIQQNVDGSAFFNRSWQEFKVGFNGSNGNYWMGNEMLHQLTKDGRYKLRFDLQQRGTGAWFWAEYRMFVVHSEADNYELVVDGYSSNTGYDAFGQHDGMKFSTWDRDNDIAGGNCAITYGGGFWYNSCHHCGVNMMRSAGYYFWSSLTGGVNLQTTRMWLLCRQLDASETQFN